MTQKYPLSPEMQRFVQQSEAFFPPETVAQGIAAQRVAYDRMAAFFAVPRVPSLNISDTEIAGVRVRCYRPEQITQSAPVLFIHGGGWYVGGLDSHDSFCQMLAHDCQMPVIAVDYRLAPEHPFPAALDDVTAVYNQLLAEGQRPLLVGDSAGGNLVAGLTFRCRAQGIPAALGQVLIYPALGPSEVTDSARRMADAPLLDTASVGFCWDLYGAGEQAGAEAFPLQSDDYSNLPGAALVAAEFDPLLDDARLYAEAMNRAGSPASYDVVKGMVHGGLRSVMLTAEGDRLHRLICERLQQLLDGAVQL